MFMALGIIIFVVGCCLSSYEDNSYQAQVNADRRQKEIMAQLEKLHEKEIAPRAEKRSHRRIAKDKEGNVLAEEMIEEIIR